MTTKRTYICNFCRREAQQPNEFHGVRWKGFKSLERIGDYEAENHLCDNCLKAIGELAAWMKAHEYVDPAELREKETP